MKSSIHVKKYIHIFSQRGIAVKRLVVNNGKYEMENSVSGFWHFV